MSDHYPENFFETNFNKRFIKRRHKICNYCKSFSNKEDICLVNENINTCKKCEKFAPKQQ